MSIILEQSLMWDAESLRTNHTKLRERNHSLNGDSLVEIGKDTVREIGRIGLLGLRILNVFNIFCSDLKFFDRLKLAGSTLVRVVFNGGALLWSAAAAVLRTSEKTHKLGLRMVQAQKKIEFEWDLWEAKKDKGISQAATNLPICINIHAHVLNEIFPEAEWIRRGEGRREAVNFWDRDPMNRREGEPLLLYPNRNKPYNGYGELDAEPEIPLVVDNRADFLDGEEHQVEGR